MKLSHILLLTAAAFFGLTACDNIDEADRFEGPLNNGGGEMPIVQKNVLVEDFTGQKCSNCPLAHEEIEKLQNVYGKERIIAVALHGGPLAIDADNQKQVGLANEESKAYNNRLGSFGYPKGMIDRVGGLQDIERWTSTVVSRITMTPQVSVELSDVTYDPSSRKLTFGSTLKSSADIDGNLQVWLTESNIVAIQSMPSGKANKNYVHNHVFRATVNGMDGDPLHLTKDQTVAKDYAYTLPEKWNAENMSIVAFYYTSTDGTIQVVDAPVIKK